MNINLKISVCDNSVRQEKMNLVHELSNNLNSEFIKYNYGEDVKKIDIGFLIVLERPGYEEWYKPKKAKYIKYKEKVNLAGEKMIIEKTFTYEIKLKSEQMYMFTGGDDELSKKVIATEILNSLENFNKISKDIRDFDVGAFKADLREYLNAQ